MKAWRTGLLLGLASLLTVGCAAAGLVPEGPVPDPNIRRIPVGKDPFGIALGEGSVWVTNSGDNTVTRIDRGTNQIAATIAVGKYPFGVAVGANAIWVGNSVDGTVSRIDPRTNRVVATIPVGRVPLTVAVRPGEVWVANRESGTVSRIDPETNQVVATIAVGRRPTSLALTEAAVWVGYREDRRLSRIDPATNRVVGESIRITGYQTDIAAGEGAVWVAATFVVRPGESISALYRIDPKTNTWDAPATMIAGARRVAIGEGAVWVNSSDIQVPVADAPDPLGGGRPVRSGGPRGGVFRIDPQTKKVVGKPILTRGQPRDVAVGDGALWVIDRNTILRLELYP